MRLYAGLSTHFCRDAARNQVAEKLKTAFFHHYRYKPPDAEVAAWRNSLRALADVFDEGGLDDHGVILEYRLPLTSRRIDCLLSGRGDAGADRAVIIELKQWDRATAAAGDQLVTTFVGGAEREVLHPSAQVGGYKEYLEDTHTAFHEGASPVGLSACAYLHNYFPVDEDVLFATPFRPLLESYPLFTGDDASRLGTHLSEHLAGGHGLDVLGRIEGSRYRASRKLLNHVADVIAGDPKYVLIDEQKLVFEKVLLCARDGFHDRRKTILLIKGGPGTGKSLIAMNLLGALSREGYDTHYATGSRAFTTTLRKIVGSRGATQFRYFNSYMEADPDSIPILICDEAHRIREFSHNRFTPRAKRTNKPQVTELLDASRVAVFFIDDHQTVRPGEIGSAEFIRETATRANARVFEYELEAQFRCAGSEGFIAWVENTLGIARTPNVLWDRSDPFDFQIMPTPDAVEAAIREKVAAGHTGRVTAGYCWPWSDPLDGGQLARDVVVGDYARPWNARPDARRLAPGIPTADLWAHDAGGLDQVGCVYTAQGFEFDYAGVIFGRDLTYDFERQAWVGNKEHSYDRTVKRSGARFTDLVKNTYRVLLTRGLKGCYVCFLDGDTERFVRSRVEG